MSILSDRRQARFAEGTLPFLFSVTLVAVATIVLFSIASISQLSKATPRGSAIDNSLLDNKVIGTVISYPNSNASPVSAQIKSPSSSEADNTPPSTLVPALSGMRNEEIVAEPALILTPDRKASVTAIESSHGSTQGPSNIETAPQETSALPASTADTASATAIETSHASTQGRSTVETAPQEVSAPPALTADTASATAIETSHASTQVPSTVETAPSELSVPQEVRAQPASIADTASATAIETSHASTQGPSTVETALSELTVPQEVSAPPVSTPGAASAAQDAAGVTIPTLATSSRRSQPLRHATSHRQDATELNRLELSRLLKGSRASR